MCVVMETQFPGPTWMRCCETKEDAHAEVYISEDKCRLKTGCLWMYTLTSPRPRTQLSGRGPHRQCATSRLKNCHALVQSATTRHALRCHSIYPSRVSGVFRLWRLGHSNHSVANREHPSRYTARIINARPHREGPRLTQDCVEHHAKGPTWCVEGRPSDSQQCRQGL